MNPDEPTSLAMENSSRYHLPVLLEETLELLDPKPGETMLDGTLGGGGHSFHLLQKIAPGGTLIGLDRDSEALEAAGLRLKTANSDSQSVLIQTAFGDMEAALSNNRLTAGLQLDGVLLDLGVSSHQLDTARGFSFRRREELLDMRMDASAQGGMNAAELLADAGVAELTRILWEYGEEKWARRIAERIVEARLKSGKIETTGQLVDVIEASVPRGAWPRDIHVATRSFQGLRIFINDELGQLDAGLNAGLKLLKTGGRMVVISYHSLEDRIVKQKFAEWAGRTPSPPGSSPAAWLPNVGREVLVTLLTRKPVVSNDMEIQNNPRARSAKLRAVVKL